MISYIKKEKHQKEFNGFPFFFAFSNKQFEEGMAKFGLSPNDTDQIYKFSSTGGFYRRTDAQRLREMLERHEKEMQDAIDGDKIGEGFILEMFSYELANHEYIVTHDVRDTLNALGLSWEDIEKNCRLLHGLKLAKKRALRGHEMNNGNCEKMMIETTRLHTTPKRVLHYDDDVVADGKSCNAKDYEQFLKFLDNFDSLVLAEGAMTEGRWKYLFAIVRNFADNLNVNYCIYENPAGLLFDVTTHSIELKETMAVRDTAKETDADRLIRLRAEREQVILKIEHLQNRKADIEEKCIELVKLIMGDEYEVHKKRGIK